MVKLKNRQFHSPKIPMGLDLGIKVKYITYTNPSNLKPLAQQFLNPYTKIVKLGCLHFPNPKIPIY